MRVITGSCKGRKLKSATGLNTRPTSDMLKGMIFNILSWRCEGAAVLDLCAGSGALGIEALSRGARSAVFVEADRMALQALRDNLQHCGLAEKSRVLAGDLLRYLPGFTAEERFDLVFFDPPYHSELYQPVLSAIDKAEWFGDQAILVVEHHKKERMPAEWGTLGCCRQTGHGSSFLSFYERAGHQ